MTNNWAGLPVAATNGPVPLGAAIPRRRSVGSDHQLGRTAHSSSQWACAIGLCVAAYGAPLAGWQPPTARHRWLGDMESCPVGGRCLCSACRGMAAPKRCGPSGSPAHPVVAAYGAPAGGWQPPTGADLGLWGRALRTPKLLRRTMCFVGARGAGDFVLGGALARWARARHLF